MILPKFLELQVQRLVVDAKQFDPHMEVYEFWLKLRELLGVTLHGDSKEREIAWCRFEDFIPGWLGFLLLLSMVITIVLFRSK
jgi:hypothetical protein